MSPMKWTMLNMLSQMILIQTIVISNTNKTLNLNNKKMASISMKNLTWKW